MKKFASTVALLGLALAATLPVQAATFSFSGTLATTDPTYTRASTGNPPTTTGVGAFRYDVYEFTVDLVGSYILRTLSANLAPNFTADDTFITLYSGAFNPATPLVNALQADDDTGVGNLSQITRNLSIGTNYFLVVTSFSAGALGTYTGEITGGGNIITGVVPEPFTVAGLFLAAGAGVLAKRKKNA